MEETPAKGQSSGLLSKGQPAEHLGLLSPHTSAYRQRGCLWCLPQDRALRTLPMVEKSPFWGWGQRCPKIFEFGKRKSEHSSRKFQSYIKALKERWVGKKGSFPETKTLKYSSNRVKVLLTLTRLWDANLPPSSTLEKHAHLRPNLLSSLPVREKPVVETDMHRKGNPHQL